MSCFSGRSSKNKAQKIQKCKQKQHKENDSKKKLRISQKIMFKQQRFNLTPYQLHVKTLNLIKCTLKKEEIFRHINIKSLGNHENLKNIDFPVLSCSINTLLNHAKYIIVEDDLRKLQTNKFNLNLLLIKIAQSYKNNSYHNFAHAFSTMLLLYQSYSLSIKLQSLFTPIEWFAIFIAALAHDINHPGTNNDYQNKINITSNKLNNKQSILQKYHLSYLWNLLQNHMEINFLSSFQKDKANSIKQFITRLIFSTDMAKHNEKVNNLKIIQQKEGKMCRQSSYIVAESLFHACDLGNPCLNFDNYSNWALLIASEFDDLSVLEQSMGFQTNDLLKFEGMNKFYKNQQWFCINLVLPLWIEVKNIFNQLIIFTNNIETNIKLLQFQIQKNKDKQNQ